MSDVGFEYGEEGKKMLQLLLKIWKIILMVICTEFFEKKKKKKKFFWYVIQNREIDKHQSYGKVLVRS